MSDTVIQIENLSKLYRLGEVGTGSLAHDVNRWWHRLLGKEDPYTKVGQVNDRTKKLKGDWVWAIKDVNFEVKRGQVLGVIGRNGAGKSTLLKLLSRVTAPTTGKIKVKGRIASLLEVGTGFHPELTGRENVYLNGAILGMRRHEITAKLKEIVEFSGCGAYLETPVKRYSSGMKVRLAFAVAAFLEAEVLIVDEVLAVGDGEFQKRCIGKMNAVADDGRTLLFVSHNMGVVSSICKRAILLEEGTIISDASASEAISNYYSSGKNTSFRATFDTEPQAAGNRKATLLEGAIEDLSGNAIAEVDIRNPFRVRMRYRLEQSASCVIYPNFHVADSAGTPVLVTSPYEGQDIKDAGIYDAVCHIPGQLLNNGTYFFSLVFTLMDRGVNVAFFEKDALCVNIIDPLEETLDGERKGYSGHIPGTVRPKLLWNIDKIS